MIPNLPNNLYNIVFTIGAFLLAYTFLQSNKLEERRREDLRRFDKLNSETIDRSDEYNRKKVFMLKDIQDLINKRSNGVSYVGKDSENIDEVIKKTQDAYDEYQRQNFAISSKSSTQLKNISEDITISQKNYDINVVYGAVSFLIMGVGLVGLMGFQIRQDKISKNTYIEGLTFKECQSCGKTLDATVERAKFPSGGINRYYCRQCFDGESFTDRELTANDMISIYISRLPHPKINKIDAEKFILSLWRWKKGEN